MYTLDATVSKARNPRTWYLINNTFRMAAFDLFQQLGTGISASDLEKTDQSTTQASLPGFHE